MPLNFMIKKPACFLFFLKVTVKAKSIYREMLLFIFFELMHLEKNTQTVFRGKELCTWNAMLQGSQLHKTY